MTDAVKFGSTGFISGPDDINWVYSIESRTDILGKATASVHKIALHPPWLQLTGLVENERVGLIAAELAREEPILLDSSLITDHYSSGKVYVEPKSYRPHLGKGTGFHEFDLLLQVVGDSVNHRRASFSRRQLIDNTFDLTGKHVISLPYNVSSISETTSFSRTTEDGAIYLVEDAPEIIWYDVAEADLSKANVSVTQSGREKTLSNKMFRVRDRLDEVSNKGMIDVEAWDGSAWQVFGMLDFGLNTWGGDQEFVGSLRPIIEPLWEEASKERHTMRWTYPSTSTGHFKLFVHVTLLRGKPFALISASNYGADMAEIEFKLNVSRTDLRYWTRSGATRDAQAGVYGTETQAGDADTGNVQYLHTADPIVDSTLVAGWIRSEKEDCDHIGVDAGNYWSALSEKFDNRNIRRLDPYPIAVIFAMKKSIGYSTPSYLGEEAIVDSNVFQALVKVT